MLTVSATTEWRSAHSGAVIGLLELSHAVNADAELRLEPRKRETEERLRTRCAGYGRSEFLALPVMAAYERYYKRFNKTYHVLLQLESIVIKGKGLPMVSPLVDANFVAEVETLVLTAGHDAGRLAAPLLIDVSTDDDRMTPMRGEPRTIRSGDMVMRDAEAVSCSIIYGQDNRSPISAESSEVLYVAYAPAGVPADAVEAQLAAIEANVRLFCPDVVVEQRRTISA